MNDVGTVSGKLRTAMTTATDAGWIIVRELVRGPSNSDERYCCAVGSVVTDLPGGVPLYGTIADRLGIDFGQVIGIARGFDGQPYNPNVSTPDWHALGERLYAELQEGTL